VVWEGRAGNRSPYPDAQPPFFRCQLRQAEVQNLGLATIRHEDVRWLDVPMDDALGVRGVESVGDLNRQVQQFVRLKRLASDATLEGLPFEQFHHDKWLPFSRSKVKQRQPPGNHSGFIGQG
jgi:hypothetical protein